MSEHDTDPTAASEQTSDSRHIWSPRSGGEQINCPTCSIRDVTMNHVTRCAVITKARTEARKLGDQQGIPSVTTDDLWAHLGHVAMPQDATRIVRQVIDLGWRPVVGSDPKQLWNGGSR